MKIFVRLSSLFFIVILAWVLIAFLVGPLKEKQEEGFVEVPGFAPLAAGEPFELSFPWISQDAYLKTSKMQQVWVVKHSQESATVFSPICPHLGCRYAWHASTDRFVCPCHGSVFTITGRVVAGPAPRSLDTLPHKLKNGKLYVKWERFKPGIPEKVVIAQRTTPCCGFCPFQTYCAVK